MVLGRVSINVDFGYRVIQLFEILTVRNTTAEGSTGAREGIYSSMGLSHYRYYGTALKAVSEIDDLTYYRGAASP